MHYDEQANIQSITQNLAERFSDVLHILNGTAMYDTFRTYQLGDMKTCVPFNEAMCAHQTDAVIFSEAFIQTRANGHGVSTANYRKTTIEPLQSLFEQTYAYVVLWFGADMFCQMNMLTMLAYLEKRYNLDQIQIQVIDEETYQTETIKPKKVDFRVIYDMVLMQGRAPTQQTMPVLDQGIQLYLHYIQENNDIIDYILKFRDLPQNMLLEQLFRTFSNYGLGDVQYLDMMKTVLNKDI